MNILWINFLVLQFLMLNISEKLPNPPQKVPTLPSPSPLSPQMTPILTFLVTASITLAAWIQDFFEKILPCIIIRPRWCHYVKVTWTWICRLLWISLLGSLVIVSLVAVFHWPGLQLPESNILQVSSSSSSNSSLPLAGAAATRV